MYLSYGGFTWNSKPSVSQMLWKNKKASSTIEHAPSSTSLNCANLALGRPTGGALDAMM
jgi:hypothetical protein